jgi:hypothetical protein
MQALLTMHSTNHLDDVTGALFAKHLAPANISAIGMGARFWTDFAVTQCLLGFRRLQRLQPGHTCDVTSVVVAEFMIEVAEVAARPYV